MALELKSQPNMLIVMCLFEGLQIFNVSNKSQPVPLQIYPTSGQMRDIIVHKNEKILYSSNRDYGLVTWNISDLTNIQVIDVIINSSPEIMKFSKDFQYLFMADGKRGMTIFNSTIPEKLKIVSQLWIGSWGIELLITNDEKYAIICSWATQPNIMLIDISDKRNPQLQ